MSTAKAGKSISVIITEMEASLVFLAFVQVRVKTKEM